MRVWICLCFCSPAVGIMHAHQSSFCVRSKKKAQSMLTFWRLLLLFFSFVFAANGVQLTSELGCFLWRWRNYFDHFLSDFGDEKRRVQFSDLFCSTAGGALPCDACARARGHLLDFVCLLSAHTRATTHAGPTWCYWQIELTFSFFAGNLNLLLMSEH